MKTEIKLETLPKEKDHAFGKDVYLLGRDKDGARLWLESPRWECGWYWAFGYVETYGVNTNNAQPRTARDINSHSHVDSLIFKKPEYYDFEKKAFVLGSDYLHHWNEIPDLRATVLSERESREFSDLMKSFYTLKETAQLYYSGNSHLTSSSRLSLKNPAALKRINEKEIPAVTAAVLSILAPKEA